jgi:ParB family chromosome partitioning protein
MDRNAIRKVSPLNEFFMKDSPTGEGQGSGSPVMLKVVQCAPFEGHPFRLFEGKRLVDFSNDIKINGVMQPITVRPKKGQYVEADDARLQVYEILIGHNRWNGSKVSGLEEIPAYIREGLSDAEANLFVVNSNLMQRSPAEMLPSELAKAYKMQLDAYKVTGKNKALLAEIQEASIPCGADDEESRAGLLPRGRIRDKVSNDTGIDRETIRQYIRLNYLVGDLLKMVDDGKISRNPAVSLSYLKEDEQYAVRATLSLKGFKIDAAKAEMLRSYSDAGTLTNDRICAVLSGAAKKSGRPAAVKVSPKVISKFFTQEQKQAEIDEIVGKALQQWFAENGRA